MSTQLKRKGEQKTNQYLDNSYVMMGKIFATRNTLRSDLHLSMM